MVFSQKGVADEKGALLFLGTRQRVGSSGGTLALGGGYRARGNGSGFGSLGGRSSGGADRVQH